MYVRCAVYHCALFTTEYVGWLNVYKLAVRHVGMHAKVHGTLVFDLGSH